MKRRVIETITYPCQPCHTYVQYGDAKPEWEFGILYKEDTLIWGTDYVIPADFFSDGASIPQFFCFIFDPFARDILSSAVVHDFLLKQWRTGNGYAYGIDQRSDCDRAFYKVMTIHRVNWLKKICLYGATRLYTLWLRER